MYETPHEYIQETKTSNAKAKRGGEATQASHNSYLITFVIQGELTWNQVIPYINQAKILLYKSMD